MQFAIFFVFFFCNFINKNKKKLHKNFLKKRNLYNAIVFLNSLNYCNRGMKFCTNLFSSLSSSSAMFDNFNQPLTKLPSLVSDTKFISIVYLGDINYMIKVLSITD